MKKATICYGTIETLSTFTFVLEYDLTETAKGTTINGQTATITAKLTAIDSDGDNHTCMQFLNMDKETVFKKAIRDIKSFCSKYEYNSSRGKYNKVTFEMVSNPIAKKCLDAYYKQEIEQKKAEIERAKQVILANKEKQNNYTLTL